MNTNELFERKRKLEMDVMLLLQQFRDETGLTPASVDVCKTDISSFGDESRAPAITCVRIKVEV